MSCFAKLIKLTVAGTLATRAMTDTMNNVDRLGLTDVDIAGILGSAFNDGKIAPKGSSAWRKGMAIHYGLGAVVFPLLFNGLFRKVVPGSKAIKSLSYAIGLWGGGQYVVMPMLRKHHIFSKQPDAKLTYLLGHLVYGSTLATGLSKNEAA